MILLEDYSGSYLDQEANTHTITCMVSEEISGQRRTLRT